MTQPAAEPKKPEPGGGPETPADESAYLIKGSLWPSCFRFGTPLALAMMGHGLFNLVDLVIVGRVGEGAIASVTISGIVLTVIMLVFDGVSNITVALTAQGHGAGKSKMVHDVAWESFWLTIVTGVFFGALFYLLAGPTVRFFDFERPETEADGISYLEIMSTGTLTMFLIMQTTAVLRGVGNALWPMVILVGANALNIVLDIALVFGYWGFPEMGVAGAAWATVISRGIGGLLGLWLIWHGVKGISLRTHPFRRRFRYLRSLMFVGLPTSLQLAIRVVSVLFLMKIAATAYSGSTDAFIDGVGVCVRLETVAVFLGLGWGAAATAIVGQNLGARRVRRANHATWILVFFAVLSMSVVGACLWFFRDGLFAEIGPEISPEGITRGIEYLAITIPFYPVMAFSFVISRALNGAGSTKTPMFIDLVLFFGLMLPLAGILSGVGLFGIGQMETPVPKGAWWAGVAIHGGAAVAYALAWRAGHWRRKRIAVLTKDDD